MVEGHADTAVCGNYISSNECCADLSTGEVRWLRGVLLKKCVAESVSHNSVPVWAEQSDGVHSGRNGIAVAEVCPKNTEHIRPLKRRVGKSSRGGALADGESRGRTHARASRDSPLPPLSFRPAYAKTPEADP